MTRREFDGEAQKRGLQALQKRTGKLPKDIGAALSVDTQTYRRYFWGKQPLRADMIPVVAEAYGVTTTELLEAVGLADPQGRESSGVHPLGTPPDWDLRRALHDACPEDPDAAERAYLALRLRPYGEQLDAVQMFRWANGVDPLPDDAVTVPMPQIDEPAKEHRRTVG